jgi:spermidine/putrescine transport system ATP-binding protein
MQRFLKTLQREIRTTFLFITHDQEEAVTMADRICVMRAGRIEQIGTPGDVYYFPNSEYVARFFGDNNVVAGTMGAGNGLPIVETPLGGFHAARRSDEPATGASVMVVVRPEVIRIAPHPNVANRLRARVREVSFIGPVTQVRVDPLATAGQPPLMVKLASSVDGPSVSVGQEIEIGWESRDTHVVRA